MAIARETPAEAGRRIAQEHIAAGYRITDEQCLEMARILLSRPES